MQAVSVSTVLHLADLENVSRADRSLIGVSGGADSVALLHLLVAHGFQHLVVCHLNHRLRGRASTEDAKFVERLASRMGLVCESGVVDVKRLMDERGDSLETAARVARHEFFADCARKHGASRVFLAHHADDQAETVLWNLLRGSFGLKGMKPQQTITVNGVVLQLIRPLLEMRHVDLVAWLQASGHRWREDVSNQQPIAVRNRLRNEVFPLLEKITGRDAVVAFARGAEDAAVQAAFESTLIDRAGVLDPQGRMHLDALRSLPTHLQRGALRLYLIHAGISGVDRNLLDSAINLLDVSSPSCINLPGGRRLRRREKRLFIDG